MLVKMKDQQYSSLRFQKLQKFCALMRTRAKMNEIPKVNQGAPKELQVYNRAYLCSTIRNLHTYRKKVLALKQAIDLPINARCQQIKYIICRTYLHNARWLFRTKYFYMHGHFSPLDWC